MSVEAIRHFTAAPVANAHSADIQRLFAAQRDTALKLRRSTTEEPIRKLKKQLSRRVLHWLFKFS